MELYYDESSSIEEPNLRGNLKFLYELRHACNVFSGEAVSEVLKVPIERIELLYCSCLHGSTHIRNLLWIPNSKFDKIFFQMCEEEEETQNRIHEAERKNEILVEELAKRRKTFAGMGTNKAKRRLNKLAKSEDVVAQALRLALEIEDKNISAKKAYGEYRDKTYEVKADLIRKLITLFRKHGWVYGIQKSDNYSATHVIYFEIPGCEQLSWHFSPGSKGSFPKYDKEWDKRPNSSLDKLEITIAEVLKKAGLFNS